MGSSSYVNREAKNLCSSSTQWQPVVMLGFVTHQGDTAGRWQPRCDRHDTRAPWDKVSEVKPQAHSYINAGLPSCGTSWGYMVIGSQRWHKQPWGVSPTWNVEGAFPRFTIFDCDTFPQFTHLTLPPTSPRNKSHLWFFTITRPLPRADSPTFLSNEVTPICEGALKPQ